MYIHPSRTKLSVIYTHSLGSSPLDMPSFIKVRLDNDIQTGWAGIYRGLFNCFIGQSQM